MDKCQDLDFGNKFANGFFKWKVWFQPSTPPTISPKGNSSYFETELPPILSVPLVCDMEDMYGASKGPYRFMGVVITIKLDDFIWEFDTYCDM